MALAIFDLDNTLIDGDSDYQWGQYLVAVGAVDGESYAQQNARFYAEYQSGELDIYAYQRFSLAPLRDHPLAQLEEWRNEFMAEIIEPMILPAALNLLEHHRSTGDRVLIITATNSFITQPIAKRLGVTDMLATEPEINAGQFTGEVAGVPCFQEGKVTRLHSWLAENAESLNGSWFYSDSHNDLPLLMLVANPVAVDPDPELAAHAEQQQWQTLSLRGSVAPTPTIHR